MSEEDITTVIDFSGNPKNAALFFDYVIPLSKSIAKKHYFGEISIHQLKPIFPKFFQTSDRYKNYWDTLCTFLDSCIESEISCKKFLECCETIENYMKACKEKGLEIDEYIPEISKRTFEQQYKMAQEQLLVDSWSPESFISKIPTGLYSFIYPSVEDVSYTKSYNCTSLELAQLPLIDTSQSEWEQIIQIREDETSIRKLKHLRLFFHENYSGKEKSYVEDDLSKRLEDYKNTAKDWGFETITSSIQMLLTSPITLTSVGTSLAMVLFGEPLSALATAGTGVGIEIGKISLHIAKEKKKLSVLQRDHPLAYIIDAKKKLEGGIK